MSGTQAAFAETASDDDEGAVAGLRVDLNSLRVEPLNDLHCRRGFRCTDRAIQNFCRFGVDRHQRRGALRAYVARQEPLHTVCGFYYLTATTIEHDQVGPEVADRFALFDRVPAIYLGMLGVHQPLAGQGIGTALMKDAFRRALEIADLAGVWALTLDATDDAAATYYERFDFERVSAASLEMFLPIGTIRQLFEH